MQEKQIPVKRFTSASSILTFNNVDRNIPIWLVHHQIEFLLPFDGELILTHQSHITYQKSRECCLNSDNSTVRSRSQPLTPRGRGKGQKLKCKINKQMHEKHIDTSSSSEVIIMLKGLKKKHEEKEQDKTKHEAPRSTNLKATQNKNIAGTTALERSVA